MINQSGINQSGIDAILRFCFHRRVLFLVVTVLVALFGYYSWTQLAIEAYPELSDVTAQNHHAGTGARCGGD